MEKFSQQEEKKEVVLQEKVKNNFISSGDLRKFFQDINELDQSGTHLEEAEKNIKLLLEDDILKKIESIKEEHPDFSNQINREYYNLLGISYFHKGQRDIDIEDFKKAYEYGNNETQYLNQNLAEKQKEQELRNHNISQLYRLGTIKYLERDINALNGIIKEISEIDIKNEWEQNIYILKNFLKTLENGIDPKENYYKQYHQ